MPISYLEWLAAPSKYMCQPDKLVEYRYLGRLGDLKKSMPSQKVKS